MKNLSYIADEITKAVNLEDNLVKYAAGMSSMYNGLGYIKMSMNYYTILDIMRERDNVGRVNDILNRINNIIDNCILSDKKDFQAIDELESIRNEIIHVMETVTTYVDRLRIYEYVLNRVEYRFSNDEPDLRYYNNNLTNDVMHYILSDKDNVVINSKISEIVAQLPVRMPKALFYDHIKDAFSLYHGAQKRSIDDFYYALSTSAMLGNIDEADEEFSEIADIMATLSNADYQNIDYAEYSRLRGALDIATEQMTEFADIYVLFAQVINDAYTICLTDNNSLNSIKEIEVAKNIISGAKTAYENNGDLDEIAERFALFEGKQERIYEAVSLGGYAIDYVVNNYYDRIGKMGLQAAYDGLAKSEKLQSGSDFVSLEPKNILDEEIPEDSYADETAIRLIDELDTLFANKPQIVRRAVMATVLSGIPVFFNNTGEIQGYINNSLMQCNDRAEQMAVIELVKILITQ